MMKMHDNIKYIYRKMIHKKLDAEDKIVYYYRGTKIVGNPNEYTNSHVMIKELFWWISFNECDIIWKTVYDRLGVKEEYYKNIDRHWSRLRLSKHYALES